MGIADFSRVPAELQARGQSVLNLLHVRAPSMPIPEMLTAGATSDGARCRIVMTPHSTAPLRASLTRVFACSPAVAGERARRRGGRPDRGLEPEQRRQHLQLHRVLWRGVRRAQREHQRQPGRHPPADRKPERRVPVLPGRPRRQQRRAGERSLERGQRPGERRAAGPARWLGADLLRRGRRRVLRLPPGGAEHRGERDLAERVLPARGRASRAAELFRRRRPPRDHLGRRRAAN